MSAGDRAELGLLVLDAVLLALLEVFFMLLRFDGTALPAVSGWPFPVAAVLALVTTPLLVRRAGQLAPRPAVAGLPLLGWLAVVVFGLVSGPGGDVLLPATWQTLLLVAAGALPGAIALGGVLGRGGGPGRDRPGRGGAGGRGDQ